MRKTDPVGKFFPRKIIGKRAQRKVLPARVYGVRTEVKGALQF